MNDPVEQPVVLAADYKAVKAPLLARVAEIAHKMNGEPPIAASEEYWEYWLLLDIQRGLLRTPLERGAADEFAARYLAWLEANGEAIAQRYEPYRLATNQMYTRQAPYVLSGVSDAVPRQHERDRDKSTVQETPDPPKKASRARATATQRPVKGNKAQGSTLHLVKPSQAEPDQADGMCDRCGKQPPTVHVSGDASGLAYCRPCGEKLARRDGSELVALVGEHLVVALGGDNVLHTSTEQLAELFGDAAEPEPDDEDDQGDRPAFGSPEMLTHLQLALSDFLAGTFGYNETAGDGMKAWRDDDGDVQFRLHFVSTDLFDQETTLSMAIVDGKGNLYVSVAGGEHVEGMMELEQAVARWLVDEGYSAQAGIITDAALEALRADGPRVDQPPADRPAPSARYEQRTIEISDEALAASAAYVGEQKGKMRAFAEKMHMALAYGEGNTGYNTSSKTQERIYHHIWMLLSGAPYPDVVPIKRQRQPHIPDAPLSLKLAQAAERLAELRAEREALRDHSHDAEIERLRERIKGEKNYETKNKLMDDLQRLYGLRDERVPQTLTERVQAAFMAHTVLYYEQQNGPAILHQIARGAKRRRR